MERKEKHAPVNTRIILNVRVYLNTVSCLKSFTTLKLSITKQTIETEVTH